MTGPNLPDPVRQARRSVRLLTALGYTRRQAGIVITLVCDTVQAQLRAAGQPPADWVDQIRREATSIIRTAPPATGGPAVTHTQEENRT